MHNEYQHVSITHSFTRSCTPTKCCTCGIRGSAAAPHAPCDARRVLLINAYCTSRRPPPLTVPHTLHGRRDLSDPELAPHLNGFAGFVMGGGAREMTSIRYAVLCHLDRVRHHLALELDEADLGGFEAWAHAANAIMFLPDGTVRDPAGMVLVDPEDGAADPDAVVPYPLAARVRRDATTALLRGHGVRVVASLPPVVDESELELRAPGEVASRCLALFACALRAESIAAKRPIPRAEIEQRLPQAITDLSPKERAFLDAEAPDAQAVIDHAWRYEALDVLAWSLGWRPTHTFPTARCDVAALAGVILDRDPAQLISRAALRPAAELLDALDLVLRAHWATTDARIAKVDPPGGLDPGVVMERHHALNWLVRVPDVDWDDVTTPT